MDGDKLEGERQLLFMKEHLKVLDERTAATLPEGS